MDSLGSSDSIKWCASTKELTFPTQLRTFVTLGSELGGKAPRAILWNDSETKLRRTLTKLLQLLASNHNTNNDNKMWFIEIKAVV